MYFQYYPILNDIILTPSIIHWLDDNHLLDLNYVHRSQDELNWKIPGLTGQTARDVPAGGKHAAVLQFEEPEYSIDND